MKISFRFTTDCRRASIARKIFFAALIPFYRLFRLYREAEIFGAIFKETTAMINKLNFFFLSILSFSIFGAAFSASAQTRAWGANNGGQLGLGTQTAQPAPFQVSAVPDAVGVASGYNHTLFLKANGTAMATGRNTEGELGTGAPSLTVTQPVLIPNLTNVVQLTSGGYNSAALKADGTVWTWGFNNRGQIGNGTTGGAPNCTGCYASPTQINLSNIVQIDAGFYHFLAVKSDGTVWAWGFNGDGQLGNNSNLSVHAAPVQVGVGVNGFENIVAVAAGEYHSLALKADGTVWAWGTNRQAQLGNGTGGNTFSNVPVAVAPLAGIVQIAAGANHNVALKSDGTVWIWGDNLYGEVGNGTTSGNQPLPVRNTSLTNVVEVRADGSFHTLARRRDGTIWAWGLNDNGQIGDGTSGNNRVSPVQSAVGDGNPLMATGEYSSFVVKPSFSTPTGANASFVGDNVSFNFNSITAAGTTYYTTYDPTNTGLTVPAGYELKLNAPAYSVGTTATTADNFKVCMKVRSAAEAAQFSHLKILHSENGGFVDRTASSDFRKRELCAEVAYPGLLVVAETLQPTASEAQIFGRVLDGRKGLANAVVSYIDANGSTRAARTNRSGYFRFDAVESGATYVFSVECQLHRFAPQVVNVTGDIAELNFSTTGEFLSSRE